MSKLKSCTLLCILFLTGTVVRSQTAYTLSGSVTDASSGESLIGATVLVKSLGSGTVTNEYGFYSLNLPEGSYELRFSFIGYDPLDTVIRLEQSQQLDIELSPGELTLSEVEVTAEKGRQNVEEVQMSRIQLPMDRIKKIPAIFGEVDVIKAIQLLPGVATAGEGFSGFFVRGGAADQNLVLLDEAIVYNASHFLGFFSVFNPDAIKDLQLYKGGIPARYGGRLASVLDIRMKEGNNKHPGASGGVGLIASRLTLESPIRNGRGSILVSGRRTYADLFLFLSPEEEVRNNTLYFYDLNLKGNYKLGEKDRLFLSGYFGRDVFAIDDDLARFSWGNATGTIRWNHLFSNRLFLNITAITSNYDYGLGARDGVATFSWTSNIRDVSLKSDLSYFHKPGSTFRFGLQSAWHSFQPGLIEIKSRVEQDFRYELDRQRALEHGVYAEHSYDLNDRISIQYGLRYSLFQNIGDARVFDFDDSGTVRDTAFYGGGEIYNHYHGAEPRFGMRYLINEFSSVKMGYNRMRQYLQLAANSTASSPLDVWFPASPNVKPQLADQWAAGYFRNFDGNRYEASVELYYKYMQNVIDFKNQAQLLLNEALEGELRTGTGQAYGAEFLVRKNEGRLNGFISYTLSRVERKVNVDDVLPGREQYPADYDKTHDVSLVLSYELSDQWTLGTNFVYATGLAVTMPTGVYEYKGSFIPVYSERNGERLPSYHRLDLSATLRPKANANRKWQSEWVFSVYNVYNRHNTFSINFKKDPDNPDRRIAEKFYLFPVIPSVTYNFQF